MAVRIVTEAGKASTHDSAAPQDRAQLAARIIDMMEREGCRAGRWRSTEKGARAASRAIKSVNRLSLWRVIAGRNGAPACQGLSLAKTEHWVHGRHGSD